MEPGSKPARRQDRDGAGRSRNGLVSTDGASRRDRHEAGAKLVLVGDPEQLQPIEAGAAFRAISDRIGYAELETIYRQREQWMRDASLNLARGRVGKAIAAYESHGRISGAKLKTDAVQNLIADWDRDYDPAKSSLILAHLRRDVRMLNELARAKLVERGLVEEGSASRPPTVSGCLQPATRSCFSRTRDRLGSRTACWPRWSSPPPAA